VFNSRFETYEDFIADLTDFWSGKQGPMTKLQVASANEHLRTLKIEAFIASNK
jgi:hypothetical protein